MQSELALTTIEHVLGLADVAIESYYFQKDGALIIRAGSRWEVAVCPDCGTISQDPNGYGEPHLIRDLSIFGQPCYLELRGHRFACEECRDTFTEQLNWVGHKRRYTRRYEEYIYSLCQKCDHTAVADLEGLTFDRVQGIFERQAQGQLIPWTERLFRSLNIDEISNKKRHGEYLLVISSADSGGVLDVLPDRKKETLEKWLDQLSEEQKAYLEEVCIDMWEPYLLAVKAKLSSHVKRNNKIKMLKRRGFGFLNFDHFRLRILVACGV